MFFNKSFSRSQNDVSKRDAYRSNARESRYGKFFGGGGNGGSGSPYTSSYSSSAGSPNPFAPAKSKISLYTQSLGLSEKYRTSGLSSFPSAASSPPPPPTTTSSSVGATAAPSVPRESESTTTTTEDAPDRDNDKQTSRETLEEVEEEIAADDGAQPDAREQWETKEHRDDETTEQHRTAANHVINQTPDRYENNVNNNNDNHNEKRMDDEFLRSEGNVPTLPTRIHKLGSVEVSKQDIQTIRENPSEEWETDPSRGESSHQTKHDQIRTQRNISDSTTASEQPKCEELRKGEIEGATSTSTPRRINLRQPKTEETPMTTTQTTTSTTDPQQNQNQQQTPLIQPPTNHSDPFSRLNSPPPQEAPKPPEHIDWTDIEPTARHPPFPNPPTTDVSPTSKKDDRPYPTQGSFIPAHFCNVLYQIQDRDTKYLQKGEFVGVPIKNPHQVSSKSFENHRKFVYATVIDIINLKDYRPEASNLLRLDVGPNRKTKTSEIKDVYLITSEDPATRAEQERKKEEEQERKKEEEKKQNKEAESSGSDKNGPSMRADSKTQENPAEENDPYYHTPAGSSCSGTNSNSGTGSNSRAEWEDANTPEEERMARKDLEENARTKLEEERVKRKEAKEAEWRAKYGFDKEDPLIKKRQQKDERKRTFWERCNGQEPLPEEPAAEANPEGSVVEDIEEVKERISEKLDDAWELPEQERKKIVKRLLLQWHPDKNPDQSEEAKVLFQHLQKELKRCEKGIPRIKLTKWRNFMFGKGRPAPSAQRGPATNTGPFKGPTTEEQTADAPKSQFERKDFTRATTFTPGSRGFDAPQNPPDPRTQWKESFASRFNEPETNGRRYSPTGSFDTSSVPEEPPVGNFNSHETRGTFFKSYVDKMRETRARARGTSPSGEGGAETRDTNNFDTGRESPHPRRNQTPSGQERESPKLWRKATGSTMESRRWFEQSQRDLKSANHDFDAVDDPSYEWVCFKCHHAAEKALKSVLIAQNFTTMESHDLNAIAGVAQNAQLARLANQMMSLLGEPDRIVYPNAFHSPKIPGDAYTQGLATMALSVAKSIVSCCELVVMNR